MGLKSNRINNDKYYTPPSLAEYCVSKAIEIIGKSNITEFIEPSGGNGVFLDYLPEGTWSVDIEPEDNRIQQGDYLELDLPYKRGRCIIGNPPFGVKGNLFLKFYLKSIGIADYVAFILPISQYNNDVKLYQFDLIYTKDLGVIAYSDRKVHCCFNIYRRPSCGKYNKKKNYKLKDVEIIELRTKKNGEGGKRYKDNSFYYDYAICAWGVIGTEIEYENQFAKEFYFIIHNEELKSQILHALKSVDWCKEYPMTATPNLLHWQVGKYLKKVIPSIE